MGRKYSCEIQVRIWTVPSSVVKTKQKKLFWTRRNILLCICLQWLNLCRNIGCCIFVEKTVETYGWVRSDSAARGSTRHGRTHTQPSRPGPWGWSSRSYRPTRARNDIRDLGCPCRQWRRILKAKLLARKYFQIVAFEDLPS